jgi:uncharacterized protein (TIGR03067 family)
MKRSIGFLTIVALGWLPAGDAPCQDAARAELRKFQGRWRVIKAETRGKVRLPLEGEKTICLVKGSRMVFDGRAETFTVDPGKVPKAINLSATVNRLVESPGKEPEMREVKETLLGIYAFEGDTLKLCFSLGKRPGEFRTAAGSTSVFLILRKLDE